MVSLAQTSWWIKISLAIVILLTGAGLSFWFGWRFLGKQLQERLPGLSPKPSPEFTSELGPIDGDCLSLPGNVDPIEGNFGHSLRSGEGSLDTFKYQGVVDSFRVETVSENNKQCRFYVVGLTRGGYTSNVWLPDNLVSIPADSSQSVSNTDGEILAQQKGKRIRVTIQFEKPNEDRFRFFSWKLEFL